MSEASLRLLHDFSSLKTWGGMLRLFATLAPRMQQLGVRQYLFARTAGMSPMAAPVIDALAAGPSVDYRFGPLPLPRNPPLFRGWMRKAIACDWNLNAILNWSRLGNYDALRLGSDINAPVHYWEHGAAWLRRKPLDPGFLPGFDGVIAISHAAKVMLKQRWDFSGEVRVIHNAVWDEQRADAPPPPVRTWSGDKPLRIGFAGRMVAFKGAAVAIQTLAELRKAGLDAELTLAGDGPDLEAMKDLAQILGVEAHAHFCGYVADMEAWYRGIDLLLHPALREPFGLIAAEALCWGAPVVTVAVDGLPEVVEHGVDGFCIAPRLELSEAKSLGFSVGVVPDLVYHANEQQLGAPRIADPSDLCAAILKLVEAGDIESMSRHAAAGARERFSLGRQARQLVDAMTPV